MANCYSGSVCEELVTIGYMRELASNRKVYGSDINCVDVSSAASFSSCCEADESAYTPTYGEISGGTFADVRVIAESPSNDVNGFSAATPAVNTNACCSVSQGECNIPKSGLSFGYTELFRVELVLSDPGDICQRSTSLLSMSKHYNRHNITCNGSTTADTVSSAQTRYETVDTYEITANFGTITTSQDIDSNRTITFVAKSNVSFTPNIIPTGDNYIVVTGKCGYTVTSDTISYKTFDDKEASLTITAPFIPCSGGTLTVSKGNYCPDSVSISNVSLICSDGAVSDTTTSLPVDNNKITIPPNEDTKYVNNILQFTVTFGGSQTLTTSFELNRDACLISPDNISDMPCGLFPGTDDWTKDISEGDVYEHPLTCNNV